MQDSYEIPEELIPSDVEREEVPLDVVFVGGGPASLAGAIRLQQRILAHNEAVKSGSAESGPIEAEIGVLEKGKELGDHGISGAVINPRSIKELFPDYLARGFPAGRRVEVDDFAYLTRKRTFRIPKLLRPRVTNNLGYHATSLGKVVKWMGEQAEELGIMVLTETPAMKALVENDRVVGVRTGDKGLQRDGGRQANFQPGFDIKARVTVLGEGPYGTVTQDLIQTLIRKEPSSRFR